MGIHNVGHTHSIVQTLRIHINAARKVAFVMGWSLLLPAIDDWAAK